MKFFGNPVVKYNTLTALANQGVTNSVANSSVNSAVNNSVNNSVNSAANNNIVLNHRISAINPIYHSSHSEPHSIAGSPIAPNSMRLVEHQSVSLFDRMDAYRKTGSIQKDASIGEPPFPPSPVLVDALKSAATTVQHNLYPDSAGHPELLKAFKTYLNHKGIECQTDNILVTNGAKEAIGNWVVANVPLGGVLAVPELCYPLPVTAAEHYDRLVYRVPTDAKTGLMDVKQINHDDVKKIDAIYVNYPQNPTGVIADRAFFSELVDWSCNYGIPILNDFAYGENAFQDTESQPLSIFQCHPDAMQVASEVYSVSKWFGAAGLRMGALVGEPSIIQSALAKKICFSDGSPELIQLAVAETINAFCNKSDQPGSHDRLLEDLTSAQQTMTARKNQLLTQLEAAGFEYTLPKAGMFVLCQVPEPFTDETFCEALALQYGSLLMPGSAFGEAGERYARISLSAESAVLTDIVKDMVALRNSDSDSDSDSDS